MHFRRVIVLALTPALVASALATPKKKTTPPAKTTPAPTPPSDTTPDPAKDPAGGKDAKNPVAPSPAPATPAGGGGGGGAGSGSGGGDATPAPAEPAANNVDSLRQEYLSLRDELFKSRARANLIASQLYSTRITIKLTYTTGRFYNPAKASIRLDGASVYDDASGAIAGDDGVRFEGFVAPGKHTVTFHVDAIGKDDDSFTSSTEAQIVVKAIANKDLTVAASAKDAGNIAYEWKRSEHGNYGLAIDVAVKTALHTEGPAAKVNPPGAKK